jgi:metal-responsive CopG/Arc/MetJ family transcriptional regulator
MTMARIQVIVQLTDELVDVLDRRAATAGTSRSELIRMALERYFRDDLEARIDDAIREGYSRVPPDDEFDPLAEAAARRTIAAEPW